MRTAQKWLALPDDKLALKLARVFTPGPWKHCLSQNDSAGVTIRCCSKCDKQWYVDDFPERKPCPVPDPIKLDWNTAKHYQAKCDDYLFLKAAQQVRRILFPVACDNTDWVRWWLAHLCKPEDAKYVLIIAAMALEGTKNEQ